MLMAICTVATGFMLKKFTAGARDKSNFSEKQWSVVPIVPSTVFQNYRKQNVSGSAEVV